MPAEPSPGSARFGRYSTTLGAVRASIVTAGGGGLGPLIDVLGETGVSDIWVLANPIGDHYLFEPAPDMVVGVLNPRPEDVNDKPAEGLGNLDVMLRLGRAVERAVPSILIVPPPLTVPSPADGLVLAVCPIDHTEALRTHLWAFSFKIRSAASHPPSKPEPEPRHVEADKVLDALKQPSALSERAFEDLVSSILRQAGASLETESYESGARPDIAFITDDSRVVVLVELKTGRLDEGRLRAAEEQLQRFVMARHAGLGLVVYHDTKGRQFPGSNATPLITRISVEELASQLTSQPLTKVIADATDAANRT